MRVSLAARASWKNATALTHKSRKVLRSHMTALATILLCTIRRNKKDAAAKGEGKAVVKKEEVGE
jgi:hypothetical protein